MFNRSVVKLGVYGATIVLALGLVSPAFAGGFQIAIETPGSSNDPLLKEAALVVRTFGCHVPTAAALSGTAEGLVSGQRKSVALEFKPTSTGVYAIKRQWPAEGTWVLAITGQYNGITSSALVELGPNGAVRLVDRSGGKEVPSRIVQRKLNGTEIDSALKTLAGGGTLIGMTMDSAGESAYGSGSKVVAALAAMFFVAGSLALTKRMRARSSDRRNDGAA